MAAVVTYHISGFTVLSEEVGVVPTQLDRLGLRYNPFEPAGSGAPIGEELWLPDRWQTSLQDTFSRTAQGAGVKAFAITGEYGSGKSYVLKWLYHHLFPRMRIRPFYFDNPGVQFYDLANALLRQVGRKDFAKSVWEVASPYTGPYQRHLFAQGYEEYLAGRLTKKNQPALMAELQDAIRKAGITADEEIAHRIARLVVETPIKPYFEYRDFSAGKGDSLVAEREEAPYFGAILKTLRVTAGIDSVAFLIDEFEELSLQKRLSRREAHDYFATMKRLINLSVGEELWLVVAMTPDAAEKTQMLEPALWERFIGNGPSQSLFEVPPLTSSEALELVARRLHRARTKDFADRNDLFPFPDNLDTVLSPATTSNPRHLVKVCFHALAGAGESSEVFSADYLREVEAKVYPTGDEGGSGK